MEAGAHCAISLLEAISLNKGWFRTRTHPRPRYATLIATQHRHSQHSPACLLDVGKMLFLFHLQRLQFRSEILNEVHLSAHLSEDSPSASSKRDLLCKYHCTTHHHSTCCLNAADGTGTLNTRPDARDIMVR